jgi:peptide/nickel transport system substrate-binding protein
LTTLTIGTALPPTRDVSSGLSAVTASLTLESPLLTEWNGRTGGRSIKSWEWFDHGLGLRLHLTPGLTLHDGTPITNRLAADILRYGLMEYPYRTVVSTTVTDVYPEGDADIVVRSRQPEGLLLSDIATINFAPADRPSIGTGPFKLVSSGDTVEMTAFAGYRGGTPEVGTVRIRNYETQRAAWAAMMRGEINLLYDISGDAVDFIEAESTVKTYPVLRAYYSALVFNSRRPPFTSRSVRRALNMGVDRQQIVDLALKGRGLATDNPVWPYHWAYPSDVPVYTHDPAAARRLLDESGFTPGAAAVPGGMPSRLSFVCLLPQADQRLEAVVRVLQRQLFTLGVDLRVEVLTPRALMSRVGSGDFDAALVEFGSLRTLGFLYTFWHSPVPGITLFPPSTYNSADAALDALRAATTDEQVRAAVKAVRTVFYEDPPAVFLSWSQTSRALDRRFTPPDEPGRDILGSIPRWQTGTRQVATR